MIFSFVQSLFVKYPFTGLLPDTRPQSEKDNDIQHQEVYGAVTVPWIEKASYKVYSQRNQTFWGSTCVAHSTAKASETEGGEIGSAKDIYFYRSNKGGGSISSAGMIPVNALQILSNQGIISEVSLPSNGIQELDDAFFKTPEMLAEEEKTKGGEPVKLPIDIDTIAAALDQGRGIILCFKFAQKEWINVPVLTSVYSGISHAVAVEDRTLYKGSKCLVVGDSWLPETTINQKGQRIITEEFLLARCTFAGYRLKLLAPVPSIKPQHIFTKDLEYGDYGSEVVLLQDRLKYEGIFPNITSTGNYLSITKNAVAEYQRKHSIDPIGRCGPKTRAALNGS